jgi:hypothetical protein
MKFIARIFLFLFIASLSTPAIVTMIRVITTPFLFNLSEKNTSKEIKDFVYYADIEFKFLLGHYNKSSLILSENLSKHDKISGSIFSPPPNLA